MRWNWQLQDWGEFRYDAQALRSREDQFLKSTGKWIGKFEHLSETDKAELRVELLSTEATQTSQIEGELA